MKNIYKFFLFLPFILHALIIEPKSISHRSIVNDIKIIDGKVYSVSNDNTLKIWTKNLKLIDTIYEKSAFNYGNLYTIESNNKYILTAGINGYNPPVFVHNKKNLKLVKLLTHNFNVINKLKFSPNKNILVIAAGSNLYFYNKNLKFLYYKSFYNYNKKYGSIYDVAFLNNNILAFVNWDGYVITFDIKNKKILKTKKLPTRLQSVDFINNKLYVGGYDGYLYIFDKNLKLIKKIFIDLFFETLHIRHSKNLIALAGGNGGFAVLKNDKVIFQKNNFFSKAIAINGNDIYVGDNERILHYRLDTFLNKTKTIIDKPISIIFKTPYFKLNYENIYKNFIGYKTNPKYHTINNKTYYYEITTTYNTDDKLTIYKNDTQIAKFLRYPSTGYRHRAVIWYKHYIISGGDYGHVYIYDINSKSKVAELENLQDHILDFTINNDILAVLDKRGDIKLYNLKNLKNLKPYLTITLFKDKTFLIRSNNYFYTNDTKKAVCLKTEKLGLVKTNCTPNKKIIQKIITTQKPYEKPIKTVNLTSTIPVKFDRDIDFIFNTPKYIILGDSIYFAYNKKTKQLKKIKPISFRIIADVLVKDNFVYILLSQGNVYKFDKDLNFIAKTNFEPIWFGEKSRYLNIYKRYLFRHRSKKYLAFKYKNKIYILDDDLNIHSTIKIPTKELYYWTFIDNFLYFQTDNTLYKINLKNKNSSSTKAKFIQTKTPQNEFVISTDKKCKYWLIDKNLNKKPFFCENDFFDFYTDKKYLYAISSHKIVRFLDNKKIDEYIIKNRIDSLAGMGKIDGNLVLVVDKKLMLFDFKTKKLKLLIKPVKPIEELVIKGNYLYAKIGDKVLMFNKNLKFIKTLKNFKIPKKEKKAYYSKTDNTIYYKSFSTKAKEIIYNVFETDKYIIAVGKNAYIYDKRLNLLQKFILDKRVFAYTVSKDGVFYYAIYDKIFRYNIK